VIVLWYFTITLSFQSEQSPVWRCYNCISLLLMLFYVSGIKKVFRAMRRMLFPSKI